MKALIEARQYKFSRRFPSTIAELSSRHHLLHGLKSDPSKYLKYYIQLCQQYKNQSEIFHFYVNKLRNAINPELLQSPFVNCLHPTTRDIVRFRLGSHKLPIETGRWNRVNRELRFCQLCGILGDEHHYIYICPMIRRNELNLSDNMNQIWSQEGVVELIRWFKEADLI